MAKINLLPWREERRKKKQQDFIASIGGGVLVTVGVLVFVYMHIEGQKDYQRQRNSMLQDEITILDKQIAEIKDIEERKTKLLNKIQIIQQLQESRPEVVHLFDELPRVTPEGVHLTRLVQVGNALNFEGKAESNARVSTLMRAIDNSQWLNSAVLGAIKGEGKKSTSLNDFSMTAKQGKKPAPKE